MWGKNDEQYARCEGKECGARIPTRAGHARWAESAADERRSWRGNLITHCCWLPIPHLTRCSAAVTHIHTLLVSLVHDVLEADSVGRLRVPLGYIKCCCARDVILEVGLSLLECVGEWATALAGIGSRLVHQRCPLPDALAVSGPQEAQKAHLSHPAEDERAISRQGGVVQRHRKRNDLAPHPNLHRLQLHLQSLLLLRTSTLQVESPNPAPYIHVSNPGRDVGLLHPYVLKQVVVVAEKMRLAGQRLGEGEVGAGRAERGQSFAVLVEFIEIFL